MARDYKQARAPQRRSGGCGQVLFVGIIIGLLLGLAISLGVAVWLTRDDNPILHAAGSAASAPERPPERSPAATPRPAFDFYDILPGGREQVRPAASPPVATAAPTPAPTAAPTPAPSPTTTPRAADNFYLQVGAYSQSGEAENLKARMALLGLQASVQQATVDGRTIHRVRLGPYDSVPEVEHARQMLSANGLDANLVRSRD